MAEFGFYAKGYTSGAAVGYDSVNGFTVSVFESVSAGASADFWSSWNVTFGHGIRWEGVTPYTGIGVPIGTPTPISGTLQTNMITGDIFGTIGRPFSGRAGIMEGGVYGEMSPFSFPEQSTHEPDPYASGNPHPNFDENGYWSAPSLDNDAPDNERVHPPVPDPRSPQRFPSHPPLRIARQCQTKDQHRQSSNAARR